MEDRLITLLDRFHVASVASPFDLLTDHTTNADLLLTTRRLLLISVLQYGSYFALIIPLSWWSRRRDLKAYGLTRAGRSKRWLVIAGVVTACLSSWPVLLFRGYYQRRLAEDWGDDPAILGTTSLFVFAHRQYLLPNLYSVGMVLSLKCVGLGLSAIFAYTRSTLPSMIAHAIINTPMTPKYQICLLLLFVVGIVIFSLREIRAIKQVFSSPSVGACCWPLPE